MIPPGKQASNDPSFAASPNYDIIVVADEDQQFAPFMPYRGGGEPRPVANYRGLIATTWSPGHEKWGATQAKQIPRRTYKRRMLPLDYQAYVAVKTVGEAVTRNHGKPFATADEFVHGDQLQPARPSRASSSNTGPGTVSSASRSSSPPTRCRCRCRRSADFPHASHPEIEVDTLGIDEPESVCKLRRIYSAHKTSSCPALCRASTIFCKRRRGWPGQARP